MIAHYKKNITWIINDEMRNKIENIRMIYFLKIVYVGTRLKWKGKIALLLFRLKRKKNCRKDIFVLLVLYNNSISLIQCLVLGWTVVDEGCRSATGLVL